MFILREHAARPNEATAGVYEGGPSGSVTRVSFLFVGRREVANASAGKRNLSSFVFG
jgi:hypothetical protein